jgi:hypothetical protein
MECTYLPIQSFLVDVCIGKFYINMPKYLEHFNKTVCMQLYMLLHTKKLLTVLIV